MSGIISEAKHVHVSVWCAYILTRQPAARCLVRDSCDLSRYKLTLITFAERKGFDSVARNAARGYTCCGHTPSSQGNIVRAPHGLALADFWL